MKQTSLEGLPPGGPTLDKLLLAGLHPLLLSCDFTSSDADRNAFSSSSPGGSLVHARSRRRPLWAPSCDNGSRDDRCSAGTQLVCLSGPGPPMSHIGEHLHQIPLTIDSAHFICETSACAPRRVPPRLTATDLGHRGYQSLLLARCGLGFMLWHRLFPASEQGALNAQDSFTAINHMMRGGSPS